MTAKSKKPIALAEIREHGSTFVTRQLVTFPTIRNTEKSPNAGAQFQQDIEPAGRYLLHDPPRGSRPKGWVEGSATFQAPLVLEFNTSGEVAYDATSWKARLHAAYGKKGKPLSCALRAEGFDGIITGSSKRQETYEIVDLSVVQCSPRKRR